MVAPSANPLTIAKGTSDCINRSRIKGWGCPRFGKKNHNTAIDATTRITPAVDSKIFSSGSAISRR